MYTWKNNQEIFLHVSDVAHALVTIFRNTTLQAQSISLLVNLYKFKELASIIGTKIGKEHLIKLGAIPFSKDEPLFVGVSCRAFKN